MVFVFMAFRVCKSKNLKKAIPKGFTLFEVLIAVAIIGTLSAMVVANLSRLQGGSTVVSEGEKFAAFLRQAQLWALTGQTYSGTRPSGGWGVHVETCSAGSCTYFIFADSYPGTPNRTYDEGSDGRAQDSVVDYKVFVSGVSPASGNSLDIVFDTPSGNVYLNGSQVSGDGIVTFTQSDTNSSKTVKINGKSGRIDIID